MCLGAGIFIALYTPAPSISLLAPIPLPSTSSPKLLLFPMLYVNCTVKSHYIRVQCVHYILCQKHFSPPPYGFPLPSSSRVLFVFVSSSSSSSSPSLVFSLSFSLLFLLFLSFSLFSFSSAVVSLLPSFSFNFRSFSFPHKASLPHSLIPLPRLRSKPKHSLNLFARATRHGLICFAGEQRGRCGTTMDANYPAASNDRCSISSLGSRRVARRPPLLSRPSHPPPRSLTLPSPLCSIFCYASFSRDLENRPTLLPTFLSALREIGDREATIFPT